MVLLLRVQVSELSLPLSCHPSLSLHDLLCLVGASRGLVTLRRVEVVEVRALGGAAGVVEVVHRVRARAAAMGNTSLCLGVSDELMMNPQSVSRNCSIV